MFSAAIERANTEGQVFNNCLDKNVFSTLNVDDEPVGLGYHLVFANAKKTLFLPNSFSNKCTSELFEPFIYDGHFCSVVLKRLEFCRLVFDFDVISLSSSTLSSSTTTMATSFSFNVSNIMREFKTILKEFNIVNDLYKMKRADSDGFHVVVKHMYTTPSMLFIL
jgi:hypothetical protein